jgi:hypothetical protein
MKTDYIETVFQEYLTINQSQYALLLNGSWGRGKTYFWKHQLKPIAEKAGLKTIFLSLNGIGKTEELEHQLFLKLIPVLGEKESSKLKNATKVVGNIINQVGKVFLKTSLSDVLKGVSIESFNFKGYIICFDDLERCQIPVKQVFGFINNLVEHKDLKTIILADQSKIDPSQKDYNQIKEKVIGRELNYEVDLPTILPLLFEEYQSNNSEFYKFLLSQSTLVKTLLIEYKEDNLRVVRFYLDSLEKLFPFIKEAGDQYTHEVILFTALIVIEFKKGNLASSDYNDPQGLQDIDEGASYYFNRSLFKEDDDIKQQSYDKQFYNTYLQKRLKEYFFYSSIYVYILSGYLDEVLLEKEIEARHKEIIPESVKSFRKLLDYKFRELSNGEFQSLVLSVLEEAGKGGYSIYDYVRVASFFYFFVRNELITLTVEDVYQEIVKGLTIAKSRKEINDRVLDNLLHFDQPDQDIARIRTLVEQIHQEIKNEEHVEESNTLIRSISSEDENVMQVLFEKHKFVKELFLHADDQLLFEALLTASNKMLFNLVQQLQKRYEVSNIQEFLSDESEFLENLNERLTNYLDQPEDIGQPRKFVFESLKTTLDQAIEKLTDSKK